MDHDFPDMEEETLEAELEYVVEEVTRDMSKVVVEGEGLPVEKHHLPTDLPPFATGTKPFTNKKFRALLLTKGIESEDFTFVLCNRLIMTMAKSLKDEAPVEYCDLEALSLLVTLSAVWGQTDYSTHYQRVIGILSSRAYLPKPDMWEFNNTLVDIDPNPMQLSKLRETVLAVIRTQTEG